VAKAVSQGGCQMGERDSEDGAVLWINLYKKLDIHPRSSRLEALRLLLCEDFGNIDLH
jgi:hypothetical protein